MSSIKETAWGRIAVQAIVAGLAGGAIIDAYLWATTLLPAHQNILSMWQWVASTAIGKAAFTSVSYAGLGLALHAVVSIGWAGGYAFFAQQRPIFNERWLVSGVMYGLFVYIFMQIILLVDGNFLYPHTPNDFINAVLAHAVFFGLPVAFVVSRMNARRA